MNRFAIRLCLLLAILGCRAARPAVEEADLEFQRRIADVEDCLAMWSQVELSQGGGAAAGCVENEIREIEIRLVDLPEIALTRAMFRPEGESNDTLNGGSRIAFCLLRDRRGYARLLRFCRVADPMFYLEANGHSTLQAHLARGGQSTDDGNELLATFVIPAGLEPGVRYHLRPRNESRRYRWSVSNQVVVTSKDEGYD